MNWRSLQLEDFHVSPERRDLFLRHFHAVQFVEQKIVRKPHITEGGEDIDHDLFVHVELPAQWEYYLTASLGRLARRNARHYLRLIDENSEYEVTVSDARTIEQDLGTLFRFWLGRWEDKNPTYARGVVRNCRTMLPGLYHDDRLLVLVLRQDSVPIGVHLNFIDRDKRAIHCFLVGRDPAVTKLPPGFALHMFTMRWAIANGFVNYDLGTGNYGYKAAFGSQTRLIEGIRISTQNARNLGERLDRRILGSVLSWSKRLHSDGQSKLAAMGCSQILEVDHAFEKARELLELIEAETAPNLANAIELHRSGRVEQAAQIYASVLAKAPRHFKANYMMGVACLQKREFAAAELYLGQAIEVAPRQRPAGDRQA
ncbi:Protein involved in cellulose biosynthesis (CelD) [Aminobacter sp. MSH1]|nr:Protein involved in cellulose biosynthesis (CelD) [Aminobacter sp. MSH1]